MRARILKVSATFITLAWVTASAGCTSNSPKSRYLLGERLFTDGKYAAAVTEFERVSQRDPTGKLGLQALFRAAMAQSWYLQQYGEALRKFRLFVEKSEEADLSWEAEKQIGEILFLKTEQYEAAIQHYRGLLKLRPDTPEAPGFLFKIARAQFFLWQFPDAIATYREIEHKFPKTPLAERAAYEIGNTYYTEGQNGGGGNTGGATASTGGSGHRIRHSSPDGDTFQQAIDAYEQFVKIHPKSQWVAQAKFGIAACLEEMEQLDAAYAQYQAIQDSYPSPNVIKIKLARIRQRQTQKRR